MDAAFTRVQVGRSDLCTLISYAKSPEQIAAFSRLLGYKAPEKQMAVESDTEVRESLGQNYLNENTTSGFSGQVLPAEQKKVNIPFVHVVSYQSADPEMRQSVAPQWFVEAQRLAIADLTVSHPAPPSPPPLVPWTRLWPIFRKNLSKMQETGKVDVKRLIALIAKCETFAEAPREMQSNWLQEIHVLLDKKEELRPFFDDMNMVAAGFKKLCKKSSLKVFNFPWGITNRHYLDAKKKARVYQPPPTGAAVLVISDLGLLSGSLSEKIAWEDFGNDLNNKGLLLTALTPCPPRYWEYSVCRFWNMLYWDLHKRPVRANKHCTKTSSASFVTARFPRKKQEGLELLLNLFSPVISLEPGMVRSMRAFLSDEMTDAAVEYEIWRLRYCLPAYRPHFAGVDRNLREKILQAVAVYHGGIQELVDVELKTIRGLATTDMKGLVDKVAGKVMIRDYDARLVKTITELDATDLDGASFMAWYNFMEKCLPSSVWQDKKMAALWAFAHKDDNAPVPANMNLDDIAWIFAEKLKPPVRWMLFMNQTGISAVPEKEPVNYPVCSFSTINTVALVTNVKNTEATALRWDMNAPLLNTSVDNGINSRIKITSFLESIEIDTVTRPPWAEEIGRDEYGLYVDIVIKAVRQRMRWINPGKFTMGSPEGEKGRFEDEKQHEVILSNGYWMFDTPVTQSLWTAVMGKNPSYFKSPDRPVEQVSWEDCREFIVHVNQLVPELELRFPSEAEWEYACRAGSESAIYTGDVQTLANSNSVMLDKIAWYSGNSGTDFKLENNSDASEWQNKLLTQEKAGTHPVATKQPNNWGLYDMVGNVWEWCNDWYGDYPTNRIINPLGPKNGKNHVLRGGSWNDNAGYCRLSCRIHIKPNYCCRYFGFRLSRGQQEPEEQGGTRDRLPEEKTGIFFPDIEVPNLMLYKWHRNNGSDEFGFWFEFAYKSAIQRMRWIKPGRFLMGSSKDEQERFDDETQHEVIITNGYWLADTACTQELWTGVMGDNPSSFKGQQRPVENVSWNDCMLFLKRINSLMELSGISLCLPAEAQWEYACRAGTLTPFWFGENITPEQVNYNGSLPYSNGKKGRFRQETVEVKSLPPNAWGLFEMHGNVWEWCSDWYGTYPSGIVNDPAGPENGDSRVLRGGPWGFFAGYCRSAFRFDNNSDTRDDYIGFRLFRGSTLLEEPLKPEAV